MASIAEQIKQLKENKKNQVEEILKPIEITDQLFYDESLTTHQNKMVNYALHGYSFIVTGEAGTGKSTGCKAMIRELLVRNKFSFHDYRVTGAGTYTEPGLAVITFTNKAKNVIKAILHQDLIIAGILDAAITTIHNLLEFSPKGSSFTPLRNEERLLECDTIVIDEGSIVSLELAEHLFEAMKKGTQLIVIGDIYQIPPPFGDSMLYKLLTHLPVIRLMQIHRQSEDNPIIEEARKVLKGKAPENNIYDQDSKQIGVFIPKNLKGAMEDEEIAFHRYMGWLRHAYRTNFYDPEKDIILCPFRTKSRYISGYRINCMIADEINPNHVQEIIFRGKKFYFAIGDIVFVNKEQGRILTINENDGYIGELPNIGQGEIKHLGLPNEGIKENFKYQSSRGELTGDEDEFELYSGLSHFITVEFPNGERLTVTRWDTLAKGEIELGYATTIHKSQGSQWRRVFIVLHSCHGHMMNREMLYTAITRAEEMAVILIEKQSLLGLWTRKTEIPGNSFEDKLIWLSKKYAKEDIDLSKLTRIE